MPHTITRTVLLTNPATRTEITLLFFSAEDPQGAVEILQAGAFAGTYTIAQAEAGIAKARAVGWPVVDE